MLRSLLRRGVSNIHKDNYNIYGLYISVKAIFLFIVYLIVQVIPIDI